MFTLDDLIKSVVISLVVSTLIIAGSSSVKSFIASKKANNSGGSGYSDDYVKSMKKAFIIAYFLTICIAVTLILLSSDLQNPLVVFLCAIGFFTAFLTGAMFYRLDDVLKYLRKQSGNKTNQDAAHGTIGRDISA